MTVDIATIAAGPLRPEPKRDRYGRYLIEGKPYTRATTWADTLDGRYNLELWKRRQVLLGVTHRPDLVALAAAASPDEKKKLDRLCDDATEAAAASSGANLGTALHAFTEKHDMGVDVRVPAPWDADVAAYITTMDGHGIVRSAEWVERILVVPELGVAGTTDRLVTYLGHRRIGDLKTGANLDFSWGSIAIQLALYANATFVYDPATDGLAPMPADVDKETALVFHLPVGKATCTVYEVDIAAGWEAALLAAQVRSWRKRKNLASPLSTFVTVDARKSPPPSTLSVAAGAVENAGRVAASPAPATFNDDLFAGFAP